MAYDVVCVVRWYVVRSRGIQRHVHKIVHMLIVLLHQCALRKGDGATNGEARDVCYLKWPCVLYINWKAHGRETALGRSVRTTIGYSRVNMAPVHSPDALYNLRADFGFIIVTLYFKKLYRELISKHCKIQHQKLILLATGAGYHLSGLLGHLRNISNDVASEIVIWKENTRLRKAFTSSSSITA